MLELFIDLDRPARAAARTSATLSQSLRIRPELMLRDNAYPIRLHLFRDGHRVEIGEDQVLAFAGKILSTYTEEDSVNLFFTDEFSVTSEGHYEGSVNLNTFPFIGAMEDRSNLDLLIEIELQGPGESIVTILQIPAVGIHDVYRGDEGEPSETGPSYLTTTAAEQLYVKHAQMVFEKDENGDIMPKA